MTRNIDCLLFYREVENTFSMSENQNEKVDQEVIPVEEINADSTTIDSDGEVILPPRRKKRRRAVYLDFKKVFEIFPELDTDVLCKLSEMVVISPSKVLKLVPNTSPAQLAEFLSVAEDSVSRRKIDRQEPPKVPKLAALENQGERISLLGDLKKLQVDTSVKAPKLACPTEEKSEFMDSLMKLIPPKDESNQCSSVQISEQFRSKILNSLEAAHPNNELGVEHFEQVYEKLRKDPMARSRLESIYAARAHKYWSCSFRSKILV